MAWTHQIDVMLGFAENLAESQKQAEELANRTLGIDDTVSSAYTLLSRIYTYRRHYKQAIAAAEGAVELEPNNAGAINSMAEMMVFAGRLEEALVLVKKAMRLSPYPPNHFLHTAGFTNYHTGRYEAAITEFKKFLRRQQHGPMARSCRKGLIISYMALGLEEEARAEAEKFLEQDPKKSIAVLIKQTKRFPWKDYAFLDRQAEFLRKAGMPE